MYIDVSRCSEDKLDRVPSCVNYKGQAPGISTQNIFNDYFEDNRE